MPIILSDALEQFGLKLSEAGIENPKLDCELLTSFLLKKERHHILANKQLITLTDMQYSDLNNLINRRINREPVSKIIGNKEFWGLNFRTSSSVLDPRPDSETMIGAIIKNYPDKEANLTILDLGTGSGCLILSLLSEYKNACGVAIDINNDSLEIAKENADNLGLSSKIEFYNISWMDKDKMTMLGKFDIIISNPPYIRSDEIPTLSPEVNQYDPIVALDGGSDGLNCYRDIAKLVPNMLKNNNKGLFLEIGINQEKDITDILLSAGFKDNSIQYYKDINQIVRIIAVT